MNRWIVCLCSFVSALGSSLLFAADAGTQPLDFNRDIRPILSDNCFVCHGPDDAHRKGGLRLDQRLPAISAAESGDRAIVPGNAELSQLLQRVTSTDSDLLMPPTSSSKRPLNAEQISKLRRWIEEGATYTSHWAFSGPVRPQVPEVDHSLSEWTRNPIDHFIVARMQSEALAPSAEADRITLLRRLTLDLIGLPPEPADVDRFQESSAANAWNIEVDRLLDSPHFGERWARHWLDAARYADSDGFEKDKSRQVWFYRDWVIKAFNQDLPYRQFILEQIAGDLLPDPSQDQIVATGFLRNSMLNEEGGVDPEQFRMDAIFDRMDAIGKSILGLTIQCAQCHSHKYDPITQEEYYRLFAFLNNDHESQIVVYTPEEFVRMATLRAQMEQVEKSIRQSIPDWPQRLAEWEQKLIDEPRPEWTVLHLENAGDNSQRYFDMGDGSILAQGYAPTKFATNLRGSTKLSGITAIRLEQLTDPNLPCGGPGRSFKGTSALTEIHLEVADAANPQQKQFVKFIRALADYGNSERELEANFYDKTDKRRVTGPVEFAIDGNDDTAWGIDAGPGRRNVPRQAVFIAERPFGFEQGTLLSFALKQNHGGWNSDDHMNHNLGRFRLSATSADALMSELRPIEVDRVLKTPVAERTPLQTATLFSYWRTTRPELAVQNRQIEELWSQWPEGSTALVLAQRSQPRETRLLKRGDFLHPLNPVRPGVPAFLHALAETEEPPNRLTLARWLVDRRSPTAARVIVNRIWQEYFGTGLVQSSEDLGTQSDSPSHPELLDWLAVELMEPTVQLPGEPSVEPWSLKHLHRLIVTSATYRQSSRVTAGMYERDPLNRWLARAPRLRVDGEIVRDIALSASGLLNPKIGGPSIFSPAPAFLFQPPASYGPFTWTEATGPERYRRAIYTFRRRSTPYPMLTNFDTPNGDSSCVRRTRSNTPLQALTTLNESLFLEAARGLAQLTLSQTAATDLERLDFAFRRCVARSPETAEQQVLLRLLNQQLQRFQDQPDSAWQVAANDPERPPELTAGQTPAMAAAWTIVSRVLLNLDETVTKE